MLTRRHGTALAALALGTSLTLTGCFSNPLDGLIGGGVENIIENATGGLIGGASEGELPRGFPSEIPVVEGDIQGGFGLNVENANAWTVVVQVANGSVDEISAHIAGQMVSAGFEASDVDASFAGRSVATYTKGDLSALVTVSNDDGTAPTVTYIVSRGS